MIFIAILRLHQRVEVNIIDIIFLYLHLLLIFPLLVTRFAGHSTGIFSLMVHLDDETEERVSGLLSGRHLPLLQAIVPIAKIIKLFSSLIRVNLLDS